MIQIKKSIFLVEDEDILRTKITSYLENNEMMVKSFSFANEASKQLNNDQKKSDLYILDHKLPDGLGFDIAKEIRNKFSNATILLMTAHSNTNLAINSVNIGIDHFLEKPFKKELFLSTVKNLLEKQAEKDKLEEMQIHFTIQDHCKKTLRSKFELSNREIEVIEALFLLDKNELIAKKLFISVGTVKNHLSTIYQKTFIANKRELKELIQKINSQKEI